MSAKNRLTRSVFFTPTYIVPMKIIFVPLTFNGSNDIIWYKGGGSMSRQFDEYMGGKFDLYGTEYELVEPVTVEELVKALEVKVALETYISGLMHDEDSSGYENLLQEQEDYITEYCERLGEFDNTILANNIVFLAKKAGMRVGDLENALGISSGYISRTLGEKAKKKISIDIVWKIARMFDTDIRTLTEKEMWVSHSNTDLLEKFLDRLYMDTKDNYFSWNYDGGVMTVLNERYKTIGLVHEEADETAVYHPFEHLNSEVKWILHKDIVYLECFDKIKDLAIIPYKSADSDNLIGYDFILIWEVEGTVSWEKVFYTSDDPFGTLKEKADILYDLIEQSEFDAKLTPKMHQFISQYVEGGRPE